MGTLRFQEPWNATKAPPWYGGGNDVPRGQIIAQPFPPVDDGPHEHGNGLGPLRRGEGRQRFVA